MIRLLRVFILISFFVYFLSVQNCNLLRRCPRDGTEYRVNFSEIIIIPFDVLVGEQNHTHDSLTGTTSDPNQI